MLQVLPDNDPRTWILAFEARELVETALGRGAHPSARDTIITRLRNGLIAARCGSVSYGANEVGKRPVRGGQCELTPDFWDKIINGTENWRANDFASYGYISGYGSATVHVFDVEFFEEDIRKIHGVPPRSLISAKPTVERLADSASEILQMDEASIRDNMMEAVARAPIKQRHPGGRPPNPHFEEAINEVWRAIYEEGYQPSLQADIETRIAEWFSTNGLREPGTTQIRQRAKMIWKALGK